MVKIIVTKKIFSEIENRNLIALLDVIIPANEARGLPSAAELNYLEYLEKFGADQISTIKEELEGLNKAALDKTQRPFFDLEKGEQQELCGLLREMNHRFARTILVQTLNCYYQDSRVLNAWGRKAGAQFPRGNKVPQDDLTMLDPVRKRGKIFREVGEK